MASAVFPAATNSLARAFSAMPPAKDADHDHRYGHGHKPDDLLTTQHGPP
ncbi:MAG: hypothetical protein M5R36_06195 [Deltaproteobacteria bacterium]|nr:hypothetical protein [Deltaproteobacteria bacterium]